MTQSAEAPEATREAIPETPRGNLDGALSRAGNRPGVLRELDLARVLSSSSARPSSSGPG